VNAARCPVRAEPGALAFLFLQEIYRAGRGIEGKERAAAPLPQDGSMNEKRSAIDPVAAIKHARRENARHGGAVRAHILTVGILT
jgi:hypothetical protein